jgi:integrase
MLRRRREIAIHCNPFDYVYPATGKSLSQVGHTKWFNRLLMRVAAKASVDMHSRHGLRRTYASIGAQLGVNVFILKRLMNHRSGASSDITMQYAQQSPETLRDPAETIAQFILRCGREIKSAEVVPISAVA